MAWHQGPANSWPTVLSLAGGKSRECFGFCLISA